MIKILWLETLHLINANKDCKVYYYYSVKLALFDFKADKFVFASSVLKNCWSILFTKSTYRIRSPGGIRYLSTTVLIYSSVKLKLKKLVAVDKPDINLS